MGATRVLLTAEQFDNYPFEEDKRYELDEGELIEIGNEEYHAELLMGDNNTVDLGKRTFEMMQWEIEIDTARIDAQTVARVSEQIGIAREQRDHQRKENPSLMKSKCGGKLWRRARDTKQCAIDSWN